MVVSGNHLADRKLSKIHARYRPSTFCIWLCGRIALSISAFAVRRFYIFILNQNHNYNIRLASLVIQS